MSLLQKIRSLLRIDLGSDRVHARLKAMTVELQRADPIYLPSKFWKDLNQINTAQLIDEGFDNFKRTLNQNYFNWAPHSSEDNQYLNLQSYWNAEPGGSIQQILEGDKKLLNMFGENMLDTAEKARIYVHFVSLLWWFAGRTDPIGLTAILSEPAIGNPLRIM